LIRVSCVLSLAQARNEREDVINFPHGSSEDAKNILQEASFFRYYIVPSTADWQPSASRLKCALR
jgi:hypothetical protein